MINKKICPVTNSEFTDISGSMIKKCFYHYYKKGEHIHGLFELENWITEDRICVKLRPFIIKKIEDLGTR